MNLNKGCIEIVLNLYDTEAVKAMNLNKGCIEILGMKEQITLLER